jgi:predicted CXXCH cytochrome family protein
MPLGTQRRVWALPVLLGALAAMIWLASRSLDPEPPDAAEGDSRSAVSDAYAGSASCRQCHRRIHDEWAASHHALAEVPFDAERHGRAFAPERTVRHGTRTSTARVRDGVHEVVTEGEDGAVRPLRPVRVIGVDPLWQPVVAAPGGRYQVMNLAYDPRRDEWFDVHGGEDRRPHEWGYWTNRGMTWNSMCASCHTTDFRKGYDAAADAYDSKYLELGAGCEACHGPYRRHVDAMVAAGKAGEVAASGDAAVSWPPKAFLQSLATSPPAPGERPRGRLDVVNDACGSCHARRNEITGRFVPGERFLDHYRPVIPDETDVFYADGQVREEDYEYVPFLSSRMYEMGVRCIHCHEPHTAKPRAAGIELCLGCHEGKIDPAAHSHHEPASPGAQCAGCHMPLTTYMQRHPRRDHGFTIPDPLLTREHGIPNACNRCHTEESTDWAVRWCETWYGPRMERATRRRARHVARGRRGDETAVDLLLALWRDDPSALWRSVVLRLLGPWALGSEAVRDAVLSGLTDPDPLVRSTAVQAAEGLVDAELVGEAVARDAREKLRALLEDPLRLVRVEAAWALRRELDVESPAGRELVHSLEVDLDQPGGALRRAVFHFDRARLDAERFDPQELERARAWLENAARWDPSSAVPHDRLAVVHSAAGRAQEAVRSLERARALEPQVPDYALRLGLALAEAGREEEAAVQMEEACRLDERFTRAWYNLALLRNELGRVEAALEAIDRAVRLEPSSPHYRTTRAAILAGLGRDDEAREAVRDAENLRP